jgi:hypothetical protein
MSWLKRILGLETHAERLAGDLFSEAGERRRTLAAVEADRAVQDALATAGVQEVVREQGVTELHVAEVYRRVCMDHGSRKAAAAAADPHVLRWFAANADERCHLTFGQSLEFAQLMNLRVD